MPCVCILYEFHLEGYPQMYSSPGVLNNLFRPLLLGFSENVIDLLSATDEAGHWIN